jgi:hypothetical protein
MRRNLSVLLALLLALFFCPAGCKKSAEADRGDAISDASGDATAASGKARKGKKRDRKKKKKSEAAEKGKKDEGSAGREGDKTGKEGDQKAGETSDKAAGDRPAGEKDVVENPTTDKGTGARPAADNAAAPAGERVPGDRPPPPGAAERPVPPAAVVPPPAAERPPVARYLTVADLAQHLPEKGWISYGPVQGIPSSAQYDSVLYRIPGTNRFAAVQVWDLETYAQALEKWNELFSTYPNAQELTENAFVRPTFFSLRNQVTCLTFLEPDHAMVISVSCHTESCSDTALYGLAKIVYARAH